MELRKQGLLLEKKDDAASFLGVTMDRSKDGSIDLKQVGPIYQILEALDPDTMLVTKKGTPIEAAPLIKNEDGKGPQGSFSHTRVVEMLLCVSSPSRPAITNAINCCARYMFNLSLSHDNALKLITRYPKKTREQGFDYEAL